MIEGLAAIYIFMLAGFTGYEIISKVPVILHTPLMSGSNFVHGIVLVGAMVALGIADSTADNWFHRRFTWCWKRGRRLCGH
jgi:NAD(P) transhydrogenase subunit alpha